MEDAESLVLLARDFIQGMRSSWSMRGDTGTVLMEARKPQREGTCMVERCARLVETSCGGCREACCQRCTIAAELRSSEDRLNAERDAELIALSTDDQDQDLENVLDRIVGSLCDLHRPFGRLITQEWYIQRDLMAPPCFSS